VCAILAKEGLTEEAGFPIVEVTRANARVVAGGDLTTEVTETTELNNIGSWEAAANRQVCLTGY